MKQPHAETPRKIRPPRYSLPVKVSGFTFLRNGQKLGYPFVASIRSVLPIVDEFVIALGPCDDDTENMVRAIADPKIRIIHTHWNERLRPDYSIKGFVYGQQKSIALFNCTGDWAFYLEADEVLHENDLPKIRAAMEKHLGDERVGEALAFEATPAFLRQRQHHRLVARLVSQLGGAHHPQHHPGVVVAEKRRCSSMSSKTHKKSRYPRAAHTGATIHHYGNWVRNEEQMNLKAAAVQKFWQNKSDTSVDYSQVDSAILRLFHRHAPANGAGLAAASAGIVPGRPEP